MKTKIANIAGTYVVLVQVIEHVQFIQSNSTLEWFDEGALRNRNISPNVHVNISRVFTFIFDLAGYN